jgi:hypothetical protein
MQDFNSQQDAPPAKGWTGPVRRITLGWGEGDWRVEHETRVESMTLPLPDTLPDGDLSRGFWIEAIGANARVIHREVTANPMLGMEQFEEDGEITRLIHDRHDVVIEIVVPDVDDLQAIHLVSNLPTNNHDGTTDDEPPDHHKPPISHPHRDGPIRFVLPLEQDTKAGRK